MLFQEQIEALKLNPLFAEKRKLKLPRGKAQLACDKQKGSSKETWHQHGQNCKRMGAISGKKNKISFHLSFTLNWTRNWELTLKKSQKVIADGVRYPPRTAKPIPNTPRLR